MVFTTAGGGANQLDTGYEISNSFRFDDASSTFLQRTNGANTGEDNATLSFWFKLGNIKTANNGGTIFCEGNTSGDHVIQLYAQKIYIGSENFNLMYPNLIRDPSAWYHLFVAFDSTQGTAANRVKPYLNGVLLENPTTFTTYPDQNENLNITKNGTTTRIGGRGNSGDESFDGYLAEFHYLDGTTKAYTDFGEFNDNGVWIPKKYIGGSYGDNGFFLEFKQTGGSADASGLGADTSGNNNHFSGDNVVGATDITTDTPTNNFCTLNPLTARTYPVLREGNLQQHEHGTGDSAGVAATIMPINGKWYAELYLESPSGGDYPFFGITDTLNLNNKGDYGSKMAAGFEIDGQTNNQSTTNFGTITNTNTGWPSFADNDIVQFALDLDNRKLWIGRNGTYINSGNPASGSNQQLSWTVSDNTSLILLGYDGSGGGGSTSKWNYGNPPFSISSGNADANGYGNFEYAVPSGFYALCTKNLAEYG